MNYRLHATATFSRRRIYETFISPSFYVAMSVGLLLGYFLVSGFVGAVDSSGLNFALNPVYELLTMALSGAFGDTFILQLFVEGPFPVCAPRSFPAVPLVPFRERGLQVRFREKHRSRGASNLWSG